MPIQIKELVIKINVETESVQKKEETFPFDKEEFIEECIDRVIAEIEYRLED